MFDFVPSSCWRCEGYGLKNVVVDHLADFERTLEDLGADDLIKVVQGFPPIATNPLGNTTISVAIGGYCCTETVIWLQFVCLLQHKI
jgi:hypothetical protein